MESRASPTEKRGFDRPAISRRSCDQCRARKIGCDRATPCSNCVSARVNCTHSRIAPKTSTARQRVLVSEQYERKIDDISRDVSSIKSLLAGLDLNRIASAQTSHEQHHSASISSSLAEANNSEKLRPPATTAPPPRWDYSAHIIDFVQSIIQDNGSVQADTEWSSTVSSLKSLANALENTQMTRSQQTKPHEPLESIPEPALEAIVDILRWAKDHSRDYRVVWICRFLPLDVFLDICNKVYFRVEDHTEAEFIIANSFLSYVFAEYAVIHGDAKTQEYCRFYRSKVGCGLTKLTLLAAPCMELIAALALGAIYLVEESRASQSWTLISTAMTLCQTLGYHRLDSPKDGHQHMQSDLFWVVYAYEKGLSLRLGRCSGVRDSEVSLTRQENQHRSIRLGRIQGKAYDQLYSPEGLTTSNATRCEVANSLSQELQSIIDETHHEIAQALTERRDMNDDPMKVIYLHCDLVCQSALTAMVLRVLPGSQGMEVHESCLTVARNTLDLHDQCMKLVNGCKDPLLIRRYINWAILHTPFFPFSIVFTHAVRYSIVEDFDRLDRFASSFKPESSQSEPVTHPHRLYELLSKAARLSAKACPELSHTSESLSSSTDFTMIDPEAVNTVDEIAATDAIGTEYDASLQIGDWFHSNQQFMRLMHEDVPY
ncbi:putative transcriptional regulatory protein [Fusarium oxysporum f. sp. cubense]|uniref:Putative transcriptional regulatory protein n=1 Tax=Fusarium oxysporum f. sp. cubense TaxID=61366 RepID=A0A559L5T4_FUSOC|nr:putative transcriptional regulatory protein [Fusarium oxysporum f. sp. cubense]